jgi:hypothetical protein
MLVVADRLDGQNEEGAFLLEIHLNHMPQRKRFLA